MDLREDLRDLPLFKAIELSKNLLVDQMLFICLQKSCVESICIHL